MNCLKTKKIKNIRDAIEKIEASMPEFDARQKATWAGVLGKLRTRLADAENDAPQLIDNPEGLPKVVATELLLGKRLSGTMRRKANRARASYYVSPQTKKHAIYKAAARFSRADINQIAKGLRRAIAMQSLTKHELARPLLKKMEERPREMRIKILEARLEACAQAIDALQIELKSRIKV